MAAALETMRIVRETDYLEHISHIGKLFREGLTAQAKDHGFGLRHTGPETLPMVLFEDDPDFRLGYGFCREAMKRGVYFSPYHNMFINAAMTEADIAETLEATGAAFEELRRNRAALKPSAALMALKKRA
jgi:glutamate-1-semialdehyde 2,1-aminomutase